MHHVSAKTECSDKFIIQGLILLKSWKSMRIAYYLFAYRGAVIRILQVCYS